jgi:hypothetical protein
MNVKNIWLKVFFLVSVLGVGISAGFANTQPFSTIGFEHNNAIAYSNIKPGTPRFIARRHAERTPQRGHQVEARHDVAASCLQVRQFSKPISVYRNRFCVIDDNDSQLAQSEQPRIIF